MDKSLQALCDALKKIITQLKPQQHALSFLLLTGKINQGKTTVLRQSHMEHTTVHADRGAEIYYNQHGVIVELGESWLNQSKNLLQYTLKQLNRCHKTVKISGIILCVDINDLFASEPLHIAEQSKAHAALLERFGMSLGYRIDAAIMFTKLDFLAGFCDFFQNEHASDLQKPLGFSLNDVNRQGTLIDIYKTQFDQFIEVLGQKIINKIHPARSSIKRTLIREFPLQLASLRAVIQRLIKDISPRLFRLQSLYFTSAEQGGVSVDRLNKKIQHEYALTVQDQFPQSINYRAYFIEGALTAFQAQTTRHTPQLALPHKWAIGVLTGSVLLSLIWIGQQHVRSTQLLDEASKELIAYDALASQENKEASAVYHLAKASSTLEKITSNTLSLPTIQQLKAQLRVNTKQNLNGRYLPTLLSEIEQTIMNSRATQIERYQALKIYLMLADPKKFSQAEVVAWFSNQWNTDLTQKSDLQRKLTLLKQALHTPREPVSINQQLVSDARNYLNALPANYLYYSLAKPHFSQEKQAIVVDGFVLANKELPFYLTKSGFQQVIASIPTITKQLQADNWVLARQDLIDLQRILQEAYCYEYGVWWQNFMRKSAPLHVHDYQQARSLTQTLHQSHSIATLIDLIQRQTSPELNDSSGLFNREIASKFTDLSLMSHSAIHNLTLTVNELERFLGTLSVVNDQGKTAFNLIKARFQGDILTNPLSALYGHVRQLPEPVSTWAKQIADDTWFTLINDGRSYINQQWQQTVFHEYQATIATRYPFDNTQTQEIAITDFNHFFSSHGVLNNFIEQYLKPFLDTSHPQWQLKEANSYVLPISSDMINELIRANVITNMFFPEQSETSKIEFSLQKVSLDPIVASLRLTIGDNKLIDTQTSDSFTSFHWPELNARLVLNSIEGNHYELEELGPWAFFKMLQKVNVLVDEEDSANLQILFEVNGNSGRYLLKTQNQVNPFIPGILNGFTLNDSIV